MERIRCVLESCQRQNVRVRIDIDIPLSYHHRSHEFIVGHFLSLLKKMRDKFLPTDLSILIRVQRLYELRRLLFIFRRRRSRCHSRQLPKVNKPRPVIIERIKQALAHLYTIQSLPLLHNHEWWGQTQHNTPSPPNLCPEPCLLACLLA